MLSMTEQSKNNQNSDSSNKVTGNKGRTLEAQKLIKSFGGRTVVREVSFSVSAGQVVGLLGPNGAGKTTSFYMVVGLVRPDGGRVLLDGNDIAGLPMHR